MFEYVLKRNECSCGLHLWSHPWLASLSETGSKHPADMAQGRQYPALKCGLYVLMFVVPKKMLNFESVNAAMFKACTRTIHSVFTHHGSQPSCTKRTAADRLTTPTLQCGTHVMTQLPLLS